MSGRCLNWLAGIVVKICLAIVGVAVRKARATCSVVRPQTSRRVSAIRASNDNAG
jgi:hypothetical protein